ncbi:AI-2E family transporter [Natronolimnohabitans innermongolicus]|uniref:Permease n=1 Tax=Natronolimnohabitans innermongolicus JCM 12255 TaxID=1227499 RepID=L9X7V3_9EURY|nr:AI-2E family transporter [Natronolimnohabitans innermongolicus]ELY57682.1 hypothetical protein C493_07319 [Natronolimnohabitans innermongolicus JCM 12255]
MADGIDTPGWLSNRVGLTVLAVVAVSLAALILLPYLQYVLLGVVLAYILMPAQRRLEPVVGSMVSALILVGVAILAILLPVAYLLVVALREALQVITAVQEGTIGVADIESRLEVIDPDIELADLYEAYQEPIGTTLQELATTGIEIVSGLPGILIGLTVTVFVLFALLRDGDQLVAWCRRVLPIDDEIQRELLAELDQLMWASVVGNVAVAAIQAIALGVGLAALGVPTVVLLTVLTFVFALLPLIGAFGVWVPVTIYLLVVGDFIAAAALIAYGSIVSASDTYLRPALIGRTSAFNSAIIVVGIFGGLVVFGAVGLFIGPVILGGAKVTLDAFARERNGAIEPGEDAEEPAVDTDSETGVREDAEPSTADSSDGARDAPADSDAERTRAADSNRTAGPDRATDADLESGSDAGSETDTDSSSDAGTESDADASTDTESDGRDD